jgi:hypothetical protein
MHVSVGYNACVCRIKLLQNHNISYIGKQLILGFSIFSNDILLKLQDWPDPCDDFLNSILHGEQLDDTPLLDPLENMLHEDPMCDTDFGITSSAASDSGLSSEMSLDQQLSPIPLGLSPLPLSSDGNSDSESSSTMDCASLGDVQVQDSKATINMSKSHLIFLIILYSKY